MIQNTIFTPADILLPDYAPDKEDWEKWAVIACDQFTSEPEYWQAAEQDAAGAMSTLGLILPEVYLGTPAEQIRNKEIQKNMETVCEKLRSYPDSMIYLERTLPAGKMRRGSVGPIGGEDLDSSPAA